MKAAYFFKALIATLILSINSLMATPAVTSLSPDISPLAGGTTVNITGSGFTGTTAVTFDGLSASFIVNSDTSITATNPPHVPEVVSVNVTAGTTSATTHQSLFVYQGDGLAYVANYNSDTVSIIDTQSETVTATPAVGFNPRAVAIIPDGTQVYIANNGEASVSAINASTLAVTTINVGTFPYAIATTPDGTKAYVVNNNSGSVSVIATATNSVTATIPVGNNPTAIAITPDGTKVYVAITNGGTVAMIDTFTNVVTPITVGNFPVALAITPDGTQVVVANNNSGTVSIINTASNLVVATLTVGDNPCAIAITPDGTFAYVTNRNSMNVSVINLTTQTVAVTIAVGIFPDAVVISPDGTTAYVVNNNSGNVSVISTASNTVTASATVGTNPCAIALIPGGSKALVLDNTESEVSVIHTADNSVSTIAIDNFPEALAITPDQAPLANFTATTSGSTVTFDASASASPVGTIANYFWDFGDGATLNTSSPITTHTYAASGTYTVTLTVTNAAGTSTTQIFNPASSNDISFNGVSLTNNGGPSATTTQTVSLTVTPPLPPAPPAPPAPPVPSNPPLPPTHLHVEEIENIFATQTDRINILTWRAPIGGPTPVAYKIYRNAALTKFVGKVLAREKLEFIDHNRKKGHTYKYFVVSIGQFGNRSTPAEIKEK